MEYLQPGGLLSDLACLAADIALMVTVSRLEPTAPAGGCLGDEMKEWFDLQSFRKPKLPRETVEALPSPRKLSSAPKMAPTLILHDITSPFHIK